MVSLTCLAAALSGCSSIAERRALCDRSAGLENELSIVAQTVDDIANSTPQQLANTFTVTIATLATLHDLGPSSLSSEFGLLLGVYESLGSAIESTGWDGSVAVGDRVVNAARAGLLSNAVIEARDSIRTYVIDNCSTGFSIENDQFEGTATTLPGPPIADENAPDPTTGFDDDDSISSSYGYFVAEQFNLAITNDQAICIGRAFTEQAILDPQAADNAYIEFVSATLLACGVEANISGS
ncbi:MAG: hypothetical protein ABIQ38_00120 [Ilumatobacteraceae bacterium]